MAPELATPPVLMLLCGALGAALLLGVAVRLLLSRGDAEDRRRTERMHALNGADAHAAVSLLIARDEDRHWTRHLPFVGNLSRRLAQAGVLISPLRFCLCSGAAGGVVGAIGTVAMNPVFGLATGLAAGLFLPLSVLNVLRRKRLDLLVRQLPDALDLMTRGLRVGHPVAATLRNVARSMPDPIASEFCLIIDQIEHGDYLTDAFGDMAKRLDLEDLDYLSVSISIQHGTGGNLAEILSTLSRVIRDRMMMRRRVLAISSEGRLSAWLLSGLPVLIFFVTSFTSPEYYGGISDHPFYVPIVCVILGLLAANALILRKLVTFEI